MRSKLLIVSMLFHAAFAKILLQLPENTNFPNRHLKQSGTSPAYQEAVRRLERRLNRIYEKLHSGHPDPLGLESSDPWPEQGIFSYQYPHGWHFELPSRPMEQPYGSQSLLCNPILAQGTYTDGLYAVSVNGRSIDGYCEFTEDGFAWLVFQRRLNGSTDFYRDWQAYENGFGAKFGEFWLGLKTLSAISRFGSYALRVDVEDFAGNTAYAEYSSFSIGSQPESYPIYVAGFTGNAGDSLSYHNGYPFSTKDRDNAFHYRKRSCAVDSHGAWWYNSCQHSNLNGQYLPEGTRSIRGIVWYHWKFDLFSLRKASMKIRPN